MLSWKDNWLTKGIMILLFFFKLRQHDVKFTLYYLLCHRLWNETTQSSGQVISYEIGVLTSYFMDRSNINREVDTSVQWRQELWIHETNLAKGMNSIMKRACSLPIFTLIKSTFEKNKLLVCWTRHEDRVYVMSKTWIRRRNQYFAKEQSTKINHVSCTNIQSRKL